MIIRSTHSKSRVRNKETFSDTNVSEMDVLNFDEVKFKDLLEVELMLKCIESRLREEISIPHNQMANNIVKFLNEMQRKRELDGGWIL